MSFLIRVVETISRMVLTKFMFVLFTFVSLVDFFGKKKKSTLKLSRKI